MELWVLTEKDVVLTTMKFRDNVDLTWSTWIKTSYSKGGIIGVSGNQWLKGAKGMVIGAFNTNSGEVWVDASNVGSRQGKSRIT